MSAVPDWIRWCLGKSPRVYEREAAYWVPKIGADAFAFRYKYIVWQQRSWLWPVWLVVFYLVALYPAGVEGDVWDGVATIVVVGLYVEVLLLQYVNLRRAKYLAALSLDFSGNWKKMRLEKRGAFLLWARLHKVRVPGIPVKF